MKDGFNNLAAAMPKASGDLADVLNGLTRILDAPVTPGTTLREAAQRASRFIVALDLLTGAVSVDSCRIVLERTNGDPRE